MRRTVLAVVVILVAGFLVAFYIYSQNTRYYIESSIGTPPYKIDRKTGRIWVLYGERQQLVEGSDSPTKRRSPEDQALQLVKKSYGETPYKLTLQMMKGELRIIGWRVRRIDDQVYLVSYTFDDGSGSRGWFWEVNLIGDIVRNVNEDPELKEKYGIMD